MRGAFGAAGEIGHLTMVQDGLPCGCGKTGCWEAYASGTALVKAASAAIRDRSDEAVALLRASRKAGGELTGRDITAAAESGDPLSLELLESLGDWVGRGLASLAALLNPAVIVVGGGVAESQDLLLPRIRHVYQNRISGRGHRPETQIISASLGKDAGLVGVAALAPEKTAAHSALV